MRTENEIKTMFRILRKSGDSIDRVFISELQRSFDSHVRSRLEGRQMKYLIVNINTGKADNASDFMPEFKAPKLTKAGEPYANSYTIPQQQAMWYDECALDPITGKILLATVMDETMDIRHKGEGVSEPEVIEWLWQEIYNAWLRGAMVVGHNCFEYDFPFLNTRSVINGVIPFELVNKYGWVEWLVDTGAMWLSKKGAIYGQTKRKWNVDIIARALGIGRKVGTGASFEKWWFEERAKALSFATTEIMLQREIYERLAVKRNFEKKMDKDFMNQFDGEPNREYPRP